MELRICGWQPMENVSISVSYQGSIILSVETQANSGGIASYFLPVTTMIPGVYAVNMDAPSGHLEQKINIYMPSTPRMYSIGETQLSLCSFEPNENIRLFAYRRVEGTIHLAGWNNYQVDSSGKFLINVPYDEDIRYYAVSDIDGLVKDKDTTIRIGQEALPIFGSICGGPPSYLWTDVDAFIATTEGSRMNMRVEPGFSKTILFQLSQGTVVTVLRGPECVDNSPWWYVRSYDGQEGWVVEYQNGMYLLQF